MSALRAVLTLVASAALLVVLHVARVRTPLPEGGRAYVHTQPEGARVLLPTVDEGGFHLVDVGRTPGPLHISVHQVPCTLRLELWGYEPREETMARGTFSAGHERQPAEGTYTLRPRVPIIVPLLYWARDAPLVAAAALLLLTSIVLAGRDLRQRRRQARLLARLAAGDAAPGTRLGPYLLTGVLGGGGTARVYAAVRADEPAGEVVAFKLLSARQASDPRAREAFLQEARICRTLAHPNLVALLDWGEMDGHLYVVTERVLGQTLAQRLRESGRLPLDEALDVAAQAAAGLLHAHERGVVHRDVKPSNVMKTPEGRVRLLDFGIATASPQAGRAGTPGYMAPEQVEGGLVDWRADVYGLGCTLYELLAGRPPYGGATDSEIVARQRAGPPPPIETLRPDVPMPLAKLVLRMISREPDARADHPGDVLRALRSEGLRSCGDCR